MSKYLKLFETTSQYNEYINSIDVVLPNVSVAKDAPSTVYFNPLPHDYSNDYLTFVALEDGTFTFSMDQKLTTAAVPSMSYSTDNGETWTTVQNIDNESVTVTTPTITSGNKVLWKSNAVQYYINPDPYPGGNVGQGSFSSTNTYNIEGNIMSLMYGDDFKGKTSFKTPISSGYHAGAFPNLFKDNSNIISVEHLVLPATTLANYCYQSMFSGCTSLTTAPELPATTLADNCYSGMFDGCTNLTSAPELPVTTLTWDCYAQMFEGCTSLTTAPELPATTLVTRCYYYMFQGCTSLTTAPELPATTLADNCYSSMFNGCTSLTTAPVLPATTLADSCYHYMFKGCTSLTTAPVLPATTLANSCYSNMFYGCTSLTTAPELPVTTLADNCYYGMFNGCTSLTTAPVLPATTLADGCYRSMFQGCTSLTTAPELPVTTLANSCYYDMFQGCTSLTTAPELPATTLANYCYQSMFSGCTKLNYIKAMFTTTPSTSYTDNWVSGVAATGTFVKNSAATWNVTGVNGIPSGWTITTASAPHDYSNDYLTFVALEDGTFTFSMDQKLTTAAVPSMSYSTDNGETWTTVQNIDNESVTVTTPTITSGNKVLWKSNAVQYCINPDYPYPSANIGQGSFSSTSTYNVEGNIMSLMYGDDFKGKTSFKTPISSGNQVGTFSNLFNTSRNIISVEHLVLSATTLADNCYYGMFNGCTSLTTAPELPVTTLAQSCYQSMFQGCTSLTTAPELPATTLASSCYQYMFKGCTSLTTAPELPATTLTSYCYQFMFQGCTSLTTAPELPATTLANNCYYYMFQGCTSLTTAPELPATTLADNCYSSMFDGCTSLTTAPELPATTLANYCYYYMFQGCTKLNYIKAMFTTTPSTSYTSNWVNGVATTGTFVKNSRATWNITGVNGIPSGWTITTASA